MHLRRISRVALALVASVMAGSTLSAAPAAASQCRQEGARAWLGGFPLDALGTKPATPDFYFEPETTGSVSFKIARGGHTCEELPASVGYYGHDVSTERSDHDLPISTAPKRRDIAAQGDDSITLHDVSFGLTDDDEVDEAGAERVDIVLVDPAGATLASPVRAPFYILDNEGADRFFFVQPAYEQNESYPNVLIPVLRAGPATDATSVRYRVTPEGADPAASGEDHTAPPEGTLSFAAGERLGKIEFSIVNDSRSEGSESLRIELAEGVFEDSRSTTLTILDNEEHVEPRSRFHHPRDGHRYAQDDYRIKELHVFTSDEGGSGVVGAQFALRRKTTAGRCSWWTGAGFEPGACTQKVWKGMRTYDPGEFYYYRPPRLRPTVRTRFKNYTAYARAIDGAGNRETSFVAGRNAPTFEVERP